MFLNNKSNKIPLLLLSLTLSFLFHYDIFASEKAESGGSLFPESEVELSKESAQLLEKIKKGVEDYNKKLKSGKVEFTVTLNKLLINQKQKLTLSKLFKINQKQKVKKIEFENVGTWHIVYNFEGLRHFYDVRIRKKMEFNGKPLLNWTEKHYQFQIDNEKMLIRELKETGWVQHPQPIDKLIFKSEFNPRSWGWNPGVFSFAFLIKYAPPINVELVVVDSVPLYLLTLHRVHGEKSSMTEQLWVDPMKGYRPTRKLKTTKQIAQSGIRRSDGTRILRPPKTVISRINTAFHIEQFNQDLWFPKAATLSLGYDPVTQHGFRKTTMQVHNAIFNVPIDEKDLRFPD